MDNYFGYRDLLQNAMSSHEEEAASANAEFQAEVAQNDAYKQKIESVVNPIGDLFLAKPLKDITTAGISKVKQLVMGKAEQVADKAKQLITDKGQEAKDFLNKKLKGNEQQTEEDAATEEPTTETSIEQPTQDITDAGTDVDEIANMTFEPTMTNLADDATMTAIDNTPASESLLTSLEARGVTQAAQVGDTIAELPDLPGLQDQLAPMRQLMSQQQETNAEWLQRVANQPEATEAQTTEVPTTEIPTTEAPTGPIAQAAEDVGEKAAEDVGEKVGEDIGEKVATQVGEKAVSSLADAPEILAPEIALDADPFTAIFGAILGIGTLIAGALFWWR